MTLFFFIFLFIFVFIFTATYKTTGNSPCRATNGSTDGCVATRDGRDCRATRCANAGSG